MSLTPEAAKDAIVALVAAVIPTDEPGLRFRRRDARRELPESQAHPRDTERMFSVWHWGGEEGDYDHPAEFEARETFLVKIAYPDRQDFAAQDSRMRSDVHDIKAKLDNPANWSADVLYMRVPSWNPPARTAGGDAWILTVVVRCWFVESKT